ncbi:MAG: sugar ABC transporter, partial [Cyanobacteriota bacterium]|nr:sugar ABC transporter [Cyanobacteriota bacterium]
MEGSLGSLLSSRTIAAAFVLCSAIYCFGIGRDRYQATSEFVIKQPLPPATAATAMLGALQSSSVMSSLEDGRFLQVYLKSNDVKQSVFPDSASFLKSYAPKTPDRWSGLPADSDVQEQLAFFRKQLDVVPQELSGAIVLTTSAFTAEDAFALNNAL